MIKIVVKSVYKPGSWEKLTPLYQELLEKTGKEEGCVEYSLFIDVKDENTTILIENWASQEALDAHSQSEHYARIVPQLRALGASPVELTRLKAFKS